jgi:hypothetical protein
MKKPALKKRMMTGISLAVEQARMNLDFAHKLAAAGLGQKPEGVSMNDLARRQIVLAIDQARMNLDFAHKLAEEAAVTSADGGECMAPLHLNIALLDQLKASIIVSLEAEPKKGAA